MKRTLSTIFMLFVAMVMNAQLVKGDMNDDGKLSLADVTLIVNDIVNDAPLQPISTGGYPDMVDNSRVKGHWYGEDGSVLVLNEDGSGNHSNYPNAVSYKFRPYPGTLMFYNSQGKPLKSLVLHEVGENYLLAYQANTDSYKYWVKEGALVSSIEFSETSFTLALETTAQLIVTTMPENAFCDYTWTSSDESVATVDENGLVTAVSRGDCMIEVTDNITHVSAQCVVTVFALVTNITLSSQLLFLEKDEETNLAATVKPDGATNKNVVWSSSDNNIATVTDAGKVVAHEYGTATITCEATDGSGVSASCIVSVFSSNTHDYVDLGLPSGTLWATCNVGATSPKDYGGYYAWGETTTKSNYSWGTYQWCNGSAKTLTKYCTKSNYGYDGFTDGLTELELTDDAAYVNWGSEWRMPSEAQCQELINENYTTTQIIVANGVSGLLIRSKMAGYTDKFIFLPAIGYCVGTSPTGTTSLGYYFTRNLYTGNVSTGREMRFTESATVMGTTLRAYGCGIRPVRM